MREYEPVSDDEMDAEYEIPVVPETTGVSFEVLERVNDAAVDVDEGFTPHPKQIQVRECDPPARISKGGELGIFHLGSTVIVLFPPDQVTWTPQLTSGAPVRMGECIGTTP